MKLSQTAVSGLHCCCVSELFILVGRWGAVRVVSEVFIVCLQIAVFGVQGVMMSVRDGLLSVAGQSHRSAMMSVAGQSHRSAMMSVAGQSHRSAMMRQRDSDCRLGSGHGLPRWSAGRVACGVVG